VCAGRGTELEREAPFAVLIEALDDYLGSLGPTRLRAFARRLPDLAGVFPSTEGAVDALPAAADGRYRSYRAIRGLLEELAAPRPLVLVLDDVHWADQASVEAFAHLMRHPPSAAVLLAPSSKAQITSTPPSARPRSRRHSSKGAVSLSPSCTADGRTDRETIVDCREENGLPFTARRPQPGGGPPRQASPRR
jgi:AAA ATPase domain